MNKVSNGVVGTVAELSKGDVAALWCASVVLTIVAVACGLLMAKDVWVGPLPPGALGLVAVLLFYLGARTYNIASCASWLSDEHARKADQQSVR